MKRITILIALVYCAGIALGQTGISKRARLNSGSAGGGIEEQISFVDYRETRRVVSTNRHPVGADSPDQQRGTPSRGEFGTFLEVIFDPQTAANIQWERETTNGSARRRRALTGARQTIQAPYHGFVYADTKTPGLVRIEMTILPADLPKDSEYVNVGLALDDGPEQVAGQDYRRFSADATIQFQGEKNQ